MASLSQSASQLLDAYFLKNMRLDIQYTLGPYPTYTGEEVIIVSTAPTEQAQYVLLPERDRDLQSDMKAVDHKGNNLVILAKEYVESLYEEIFRLAYKQVSQKDIQVDMIKTLSRETKPTVKSIKSFFAENPISAIDKNKLSEQGNNYSETLDKPSQSDRCLLVMIQFLIYYLEGSYQPCVDVGDEISDRNNLLIKYTTSRSYERNMRDVLTGSVLGYWSMKSWVSYTKLSSSHFRLRAPLGLTLTRPVSKPTNLESECDRDQVQLYAPAENAPRTTDEFADTERGEKNLLQVRVNQNTGTRLVLIASYSTVAIVPMVIGDSGEWHSLYGVDLATRFLLPVILALVVASWNIPHMRTFAVTQLVIILSLLVSWLFVALLSWPGPVVASLAAMMALYNLVEILISASGLPND